MTRSELIGQLRQFIMLESDEKQLNWWHKELSNLSQVAEQRAADGRNTNTADSAGHGAPPPFVGTG